VFFAFLQENSKVQSIRSLAPLSIRNPAHSSAISIPVLFSTTSYLHVIHCFGSPFFRMGMKADAVQSFGHTAS